MGPTGADTDRTPAPSPPPGSKPGEDDEVTDLLIPGLPSLDVARLSLTEIIQVQNNISRILKHRFERERALAFTDVVGSTQYFQRHGDEVGRRLLQRHLELVTFAVDRFKGRLVDTAGDGAFTAFPGVEACADAVVDVMTRNARENAAHPREHRLSIRAGVHFGPVLTDEKFVTGDAVNYCARVVASAGALQIRLSGEAFRVLPGRLRVRCRSLPPAQYKGIAGEHEQWLLDWRDEGEAPRRIRLVELNKERPLPDLDVIRFGRLAELDGKPANDIVLELPDAALTQKISRWHFTLERLEDGRLVLQQGSGQLTEVDGVAVPKGGSAPVVADTVVRIGGVLTIMFLPDEQPAPFRGLETTI